MSRRVAATALNVLSSVAVVFGNKRLFGDTHAFAFPMMLTAIHLSCTSIAIRLVPRKQSRDLPYEAVLPLAIGRVLSIITMNMNLLHNSVSAYQLSKIALLPITTIASYIRGASLSPRALLGAALVTVGVSLATVANPTTSMKGLLVAILAILCTVVAIIQGEQSKTFGLPAVDIMRRETPVSATLMVLLASQIESVRDVMAFPYDTSSILMILFTAICAVCINFTGAYILISRPHTRRDVTVLFVFAHRIRGRHGTWCCGVPHGWTF